MILKCTIQWNQIGSPTEKQQLSLGKVFSIIWGNAGWCHAPKRAPKMTQTWMNQRFLRLGPNDFDEGAGDWVFFFLNDSLVTHFVGDKAVNWISVFFTDGVSAKCFCLSFTCSMFTVQLRPLLNFCLSLLTADGPVCLRTLKCYISYISYITCAPGWNCEGSLCEHRQRESFGRCAKHMDCSGQGEIGKLGFSFTETRCYFSVGGKVNPLTWERSFQVLPGFDLLNLCAFFFVRSIFGKDLWLWNDVWRLPPEAVLTKKRCKILMTSSPWNSPPFDATPYQNSADCRGRMSACWCQFWRFEPWNWSLETKL